MSVKYLITPPFNIRDSGQLCDSSFCTCEVSKISWTLKGYELHEIGDRKICEKKNLSEVGFEPTPTRVDCDLNAAP